MNTVIIYCGLTCPPTWFASYRDLTLYCAVFLDLSVVIESDDPDPYYRWLKPKGGMDFVKDFVRPGSERGLRLAPELAKFESRTIIVSRIVPENVHGIISRVKGSLAA